MSFWIWKFIETHVVYVSIDKSQLGQTAQLLCSHLAPTMLL